MEHAAELLDLLDLQSRIPQNEEPQSLNRSSCKKKHKVTKYVPESVDVSRTGSRKKGGCFSRWKVTKFSEERWGWRPSDPLAASCCMRSSGRSSASSTSRSQSINTLYFETKQLSALSCHSWELFLSLCCDPSSTSSHVHVRPRARHTELHGSWWVSNYFTLLSGCEDGVFCL